MPDQRSEIEFIGIPSCGGDMCCDWLSSLSKFIPESFCSSYCDTHIFQAAKTSGSASGTSEAALSKLFCRITKFIRRLETYTKVSLTKELQEVIVNVMVEVLFVLAIATKEMERGKASELISHR
jgi:hypothetical protein